MLATSVLLFENRVRFSEVLLLYRQKRTQESLVFQTSYGLLKCFINRV